MMPPEMRQYDVMMKAGMQSLSFFGAKKMSARDRHQWTPAAAFLIIRMRLHSRR